MQKHTLNVLLGITAAAVVALLWWSISDNYHTGPSYYTMAMPLPYKPAIFVPDIEHTMVVQDALDDIILSMGPKWGLDILNTKPTTLHITIHVVSGIRDTNSGWANCLNPEWGGMADYRTGTIYVCVDWWRSESDVQHAILHETIHMMGVGHYFGDGPNMMCSEEGGRSTCANTSIDIKLIDDVYTQNILRYMYGDDGWPAPNRQHVCERFYIDTQSCTEPSST